MVAVVAVWTVLDPLVDIEVPVVGVVGGVLEGIARLEGEAIRETLLNRCLGRIVAIVCVVAEVVYPGEPTELGIERRTQLAGNRSVGAGEGIRCDRSRRWTCKTRPARKQCAAHFIAYDSLVVDPVRRVIADQRVCTLIRDI